MIAQEAADSGDTTPLSLLVHVECEARPVDGQANTFDVVRLDRDPPKLLRRVVLPEPPEQQSLLPEATQAKVSAIHERVLTAVLSTSGKSSLEKRIKSVLEATALSVDDEDEEHPLG